MGLTLPGAPHRIADTYCAGRIVLAGDAAHVHSPAGGQGMNTGIQDATALADALLRARNGDSTAMDRYQESRRPVAQDVVRTAHRLTRLATMPAGLRSLRNTALSLAGMFPAVPRRIAGNCPVSPTGNTQQNAERASHPPVAAPLSSLLVLVRSLDVDLHTTIGRNRRG